MCNDWCNNCTSGAITVLFWRCTLKAWNSTPLFWLWLHYLQGRAFYITKRQALDQKTCNLNSFWQKRPRRTNTAIAACFNLSQEQPVLIMYHSTLYMNNDTVEYWLQEKKLGKAVLKIYVLQIKEHFSGKVGKQITD